MGPGRVVYISLFLCICGVAVTAQPPNAVRNEPLALPVVINTWGPGGFLNSTAKAWEVLSTKGGSTLDSIEQGLKVCEENQCDGTVGFGGSPDENGETTLDAMIMDGDSMDVGAVSALRRVGNAISVARKVLHHTAHSMLAGSQATEFAVSMGFKERSLSTKTSKQMWTDWRTNNCQPNYWRNVSPDPKHSCGPYRPDAICAKDDLHHRGSHTDAHNHDTIGMIAIDDCGKMAAGTTTNGARHKIPGRVGDSPIPGAGAYVDGEVGGAACTGDGDVMLRFLPSFFAVEEMRRGSTPEEAGKAAIQRIVSKYPQFRGGIVVLRKDGTFGAACHGLQDDRFPYSVANLSMGVARTFYVQCV